MITPRETSVVRLLSTLVVLLFTASLWAAEPVSKSRISGVAIGGHDSTAYHALQRSPQQSAIEGEKAFVVEYKGATWRFASKQSADKFAANPGQYTPAYNGHCANALRLGEGLIRTDGTNWEIFDNKLYLFYAARGRTQWLDGDWTELKEIADAQWARLSVD